MKIQNKDLLFKMALVLMYVDQCYLLKREAVMPWISAPKFTLVCAYSKSILECVYCESNTCMFLSCQPNLVDLVMHE